MAGGINQLPVFSVAIGIRLDNLQSILRRFVMKAIRGFDSGLLVSQQSLLWRRELTIRET